MISKSLLVLLIAFATSEAFVPCVDVSGHKGHWLGRDQQCAALVQSQCHRQPGSKQIGLTSTWRKGVHVKDNCGKIPALTAIATFLGPNDHYDEPHLHQHTAIFVKCEEAGIRVWDQWAGTPIGSRIIRWTSGSSPQYTGINFWTIA
ncbi:domesticated amidase effector 2-like [Oppia nitens]|uniref:domesticated amidase effector 2-like n=1 Tax=Oppia nitens TaxID=1686743 RepID=UPI0023D98FB5|nr:domesticated amidase effector 2-like [Oppia nitens]